MKDTLPPLHIVQRRPRRGMMNAPNSFLTQGPPAMDPLSRDGYPESWTYAVSRMSVCRKWDDETPIACFEASPLAPLLFSMDDPHVLQNEIELRKTALPRGIYRFAEVEILWFATTVQMHFQDPGAVFNVPIRVFLSPVPEIGAHKGDLQISLDGQFYWISSDWRSYFANRPENPLSALFISEDRPVPTSPGFPHPLKPPTGEVTWIRFELPQPILVERLRHRKRKMHPVPYLKLCKPSL